LRCLNCNSNEVSTASTAGCKQVKVVVLPGNSSDQMVS
jgi:hypothetical protein